MSKARDLSSLAFAVRASLLHPAEKNIVLVDESRLISDSPSPNDLTLGYLKSHPGVDLYIAQGVNDWYDLLWGFAATTGSIQQLRSAAKYEFGELPALRGGDGPRYDRPVGVRRGSALLVVVAPSVCMADANMQYNLDRAVDFFRVVARRLRLGIPSTHQRHGCSIERVVLNERRCQKCNKQLAPFDVTCKGCGHTESTSRAESRPESLYPDGLADT